jgi:hypothetical protein
MLVARVTPPYDSGKRSEAILVPFKKTAKRFAYRNSIIGMLR